MSDADKQVSPVKARAVLVDPASMDVTWLNEAAARALPDAIAARIGGLGLEEVVPMAGPLGVADVVREVAATGVARHVQTSLVSTSRGSVTLVTSVYRLPDGMVLVLTDEAWQHKSDANAPRRPRRGAR